ncbi:acyltransferase family protein [Chitinophaga vietnamensis]|uniref:acyltransferase family protein n=1 Tax=Chitinophaga vietnamensis TaxID=2593957 RepID=UPI00137626E1|nr:acyltransferase [Chitinophaga vietnamensis]
MSTINTSLHPDISNTPFSAGSYIKSLDGLRAVAITLVMLYHFEILHFGWIGIQLFFVLSGYLIGGILLREKMQPADLGVRLRKFWGRRVLRIFPVYYAYLLAFALICAVTGFPPAYWRQLPYLLTYTYNLTFFGNWSLSSVYTHLWSLCVEEQFYLTFPLLIFLLSLKRLRVLTLVILLLGPAFRWWLVYFMQLHGKADYQAWDIVYTFPLSYLDAFFIGAGLHLFSLQRSVRKPHWYFIAALMITLAAGTANYLLADKTSIRGYDFDSHYAPYWSVLGFYVRDISSYGHVWYFLVLNFLSAAILLLLTSEFHSPLQRALTALLETKPLVAIGKVSYGMYIFHFILQIVIIKTIHLPVYLLFLLDFLLVYLLAAASYYLLEQRFMRLKSKYGRG